LPSPREFVTRDIILPALRGNMRKFRPCRRFLLPFRPLLIVAAASWLMSAVVPSAKADLIAYFNFEDSTIGGPPDFESEADQGLGIETTITTNYHPDEITTVSSTSVTGEPATMSARASRERRTVSGFFGTRRNICRGTRRDFGAYHPQPHRKLRCRLRRP